MIDILDMHTHTVASGHAYNTIYEENEYEIVAAFYDRLYLETETDVFKFYYFFAEAGSYGRHFDGGFVDDKLSLF